MNIEALKQLRKAMEIYATSLPDETAKDLPLIHPKWQAGKTYSQGERFCHDGVLYKAAQPTLTATDLCKPGQPGTEALYARVLDPEPDQIVAWEQPSSTNGYSKGAKVTYLGKTWQSTADNNVWVPGSVGAPWIEVS